MENKDNIGKLDRNIYFCEYINEESTKDLIKNIVNINAYDSQQEKTLANYTREPIKLYMTTGGGSAYCTLALFDHIKNSVTPIWIYISGCCCSGGFYMLGAAEKVFAYKNTQLMYHQLSSELGYEKFVTQKEIIKHNEVLQKVLDNLVLENTKITRERLEEVNNKKQDWWINTKEAIKLGVIDEIIE